MAAHNGCAEIGEARRNDGSEIAGSVDANLHIGLFRSSSDQPAAWDPALGLQPVNPW